MRLLNWIVLAFVGVWLAFVVITVGFSIHPAVHVLQKVNFLEDRDDPDSRDSRISSYSTTYSSTLTTSTSEYATTADTQATVDSKIHLNDTGATTYASNHTTPSSEYATTADTHTTTDSKIHRVSHDDTEAVGASDTLSKA